MNRLAGRARGWRSEAACGPYDLLMRAASASPRLITWFSAIGALALTPFAHPHDLGGLHVQGRFSKESRFELTITLNLEHLPLAERPAAGDLAAQQRLIDRTLAGLTIEFDQATVHPSLERPAERNGEELVAVLSGAIPRGSTAFRFHSDLKLGQMLLELENEGTNHPVFEWLESGVPSTPFVLAHPPPPLTTLSVLRQYVALGFTHILPHGLDHILFVCGLFLLSREWKPLLWQVTAFTIAHSITLALAIYDVVRLPATVVEPLIALSIAYVAFENLFLDKFHARRIVVVFLFGLLHGMGFAGVLVDLGLPRSQFVPALLSFNLGVEFGQLAVLSGAFLLVALPFAKHDWYRRRITLPASLLIAMIGLYWTVQRVLAP